MAWNTPNSNNCETPMNISSSPTSNRQQDTFAYYSLNTQTPYKVDQSYNQFDQTQKLFDNRYLSAQAVEQQLSVILKIPSLTQRCVEISNLIRERFACNMSRSVLNQYRPILENIFGFDSDARQEYLFASDSNRNPQGGWMLKTLTRSINAGDYDSVVSFLHPDGILFALIRSLMTETSAKFEFPVSQFPPYFRTMIENGTAPTFFANKIISTSYVSASHLILNPFEFYIFHFGLYILNNCGSTYDTASNPINEPAYFTLLKVYLNHFVPLENVPRITEGSNFMSTTTNNQSSLWQSLSSTTTSILNLASTSNHNVSNANNQSNKPSLFKASIFQPQTPLFRNLGANYMMTPGPLIYGQGEHLGSIEWRCSTFLLMLTELWFGNIPAPKTNYIMRSTSLDELSLSTSIQPYSANIDQMTSVRIVIKHLHSFSNSFTFNPMSHANQGIIEIKQATWTSKYPLQKRLFTFLKVAFNRWPMDYTFRQPLEAWLSYIQPWRYVKTSNEYGNDFEDVEGMRSTSLIDVPSYDNHWRNFISNNLLYYTVIFRQLIDRLLQLDLSSSRNALMLFRAIKVYSQPGFLSLLREAEEAALKNELDQSLNLSSQKSPHNISTTNRTSDTPTSKAKLLAPSFLASGKVATGKKIGTFEHSLLNTECETENDYVSIFSPQFKQHLTSLLVAVQKSRYSIKEFIQSVETRSQSRNRSWFESIRSFLTLEEACFESKDEREMYKDKVQADEYLKFSTNKISHCFELEIPELDQPTRHIPSTNSQTSKIFFNVQRTNNSDATRKY